MIAKDQLPRLSRPGTYSLASANDRRNRVRHISFLLGGTLGKVLGYPGNDTFIYRLAGAAAFGYAVAYILGLQKGDWMALQLVVIATLTFMSLQRDGKH